MREIHLEKKEFDYFPFLKREALRSDVSQLIKEDVMIYLDGEPTLLYKSLDNVDTSALRWAVKKIKYIDSFRTRGLTSESVTFGYNPRNPVRHDYCRATTLAIEHPKPNIILMEFSEQLAQIYEQYFPQKYQEHSALVQDKVLSNWTMENSPFTSGIVNKNSRLNYHRDAGNFRGMLSNMVVFKKDIEGGYLVIPGFDLALEVADNTITIFNGQDHLHGVSSIEYKNPHSYRYSIVYYSLEQMWKCLEVEEEVKRIRTRKDEKEKKRLDEEHIKSLQVRLEKHKIDIAREISKRDGHK